MSPTIAVNSATGQALPELINKLLSARQKSLVLYQQLAALKPVPQSEPVRRQLLQRFQDALVDYLALGPFQVYRVLEDQPTDSPYRRARELGRHLYTRIANTTQAALAFHDRYSASVPSIETGSSQLKQDLSTLGEQLAERIELEDQIVAAVRQSHRRLAA